MKHAFLIMAHENWELLGKLICKLDHPSNDIFLHIDKKSKITQADREILASKAKESELVFVNPITIHWGGGYSQIECELRLFEEAHRVNKYRYYHIMSGVDFPIKSMERIHVFFDENDGYEFVDDEPDEWTDRTVWQFRYYHPLQEFVGRKNSRKSPVFCIEYYLLKLQEKLGVDRRKYYPEIHFKRAPNWVSITDDFVEYILSSKTQIRKWFRWTKCSDEMFVATLLFNSQFAEKQKSCQRYIDWSRGLPYTFTVEEYTELMESNCLFVRKVGLRNDKQKKLVIKLEEL